MSEQHAPAQVELAGKGFVGTCLCGRAVRYVGTVKAGEWQHAAEERGSK